MHMEWYGIVWWSNFFNSLSFCPSHICAGLNNSTNLNYSYEVLPSFLLSALFFVHHALKQLIIEQKLELKCVVFFLRNPHSALKPNLPAVWVGRVSDYSPGYKSSSCLSYTQKNKIWNIRRVIMKWMDLFLFLVYYLIPGTNTKPIAINWLYSTVTCTGKQVVRKKWAEISCKWLHRWTKETWGEVQIIMYQVMMGTCILC